MNVKLDPGAYLPERAHDADAGYDLRTPCRFVVAPFTVMNGAGSATIDTGIHVEIPHVLIHDMLEQKTQICLEASICERNCLKVPFFIYSVSAFHLFEKFYATSLTKSRKHFSKIGTKLSNFYSSGKSEYLLMPFEKIFDHFRQFPNPLPYFYFQFLNHD